MATSLSYNPPPPPYTAASDEVEDLVRALHESGLLRALAGGVRAYPQLLPMVMNNVDNGSIRSLIALAGAARHLDPATAEKLAGGIRQARLDATAAASRAPTGPFSLAKQLASPDVRRGLAAALAALAAVGKSLRQ